MRTDKNLGPAVINTNQYRQRAYTDHLNDRTTYRELSQPTALGRIKAVRRMLNRFIERDSLAICQQSPLPQTLNQDHRALW